CLKTLHPAAQKATTLASIEREYTLSEIAIMTRASPARLLGLADRGENGVAAMPMGATHVVRPDFDKSVTGTIQSFFDDHMTVGFAHFPLSPGELADAGVRVLEHACR